MKHISSAIVTFLFLLLAVPATGKGKDFDITRFGAMPDAVTMNTAAIQAAIDAAAKVGGTVVVPAGKFLTGSIELKSGIRFHLEKDAVLLGSTRYEDYHGLGGNHFSLVLAHKAEHVVIDGEGTIDGQGRALALYVDSLFHRGVFPAERYDQNRPDESHRPTVIQVTCSKDITVTGINVLNSACWVNQFWECEDVVFDKVNTVSDAFPNNDGIDIGNCRNVKVVNCHFSCNDDGVCLKGTWNDRILIQNCRIQSGASAIKFGSGAGATNVTIKDIYVYDTLRSAVALECVYGDTIENILIDGITQTNSWMVFYFRLSKRRGKPGILRNITVRNVSADVAFERPDIWHESRFPGRQRGLDFNTFPCMIEGVPGLFVENVSFENIRISHPGRGDEGTAYMPVWRMNTVPERENEYPEHDLQGEMPSWGFYCRHVRGISFKNVSITAKWKDYRPAFVFDDVEGIKMDNVWISEPDEGPQIYLKDVKNADFGNQKDNTSTVTTEGLPLKKWD